MVLYRFTLVTLVEELQAADPGVVSPFYADDATFNKLVRRSDKPMNLIL